jgi:hypothetical protein
MRSSTLLALLPFTFAAPAPGSTRSGLAPVLVPRGAKVIDGKYIVKMKAGMGAASMSTAISSVAAGADHTYSSFNGFAASMTNEEVEKFRSDPNVSPSLHQFLPHSCL